MSLTIETQNGPLTLTLDGAPRGVRLQQPRVEATCPIPAAPPVPQPQWLGGEADQVAQGLHVHRLVAVDGTTNLAMIIWRPADQMWCWRVQGDPKVYWSVTVEAAKAQILERLGLPFVPHFGW